MFKLKRKNKKLKLQPKELKSIKNYSMIVKNYDEYIYFQTKKHAGHESENIRWKEGQIRYIDKTFSKLKRSLKIIDIACGDGVGLFQFKRLNFLNVVGVELNKEKSEIAKKIGYEVFNLDMHDLSVFPNNEFDVVYSSHTLEHAFDPSKVLKAFYRILKKDGRLYVVLPYPDTTLGNIEAHGGKFELGTTILDKGKTVIKFFEKHNFSLIKKKVDNFREPEIWISFKKK